MQLIKPQKTKSKILKVAVRLILEHGFENATAKMISEALHISKGNLTYHYHTKDEILLELTKEMTAFHMNSIHDRLDCGDNKLTAYCWEVASQIIVCHQIPQAMDLYLNIYSSPLTMQYVKKWTAQKNLELLGDRKPEWSYEDFRTMVNVTCCIERGALTEPCTEKFTLDKKIRLTLDCLLKLYDIGKEERSRTIEETLKIDEKKFAHKVWHDFVEFARGEME